MLVCKDANFSPVTPHQLQASYVTPMQLKWVQTATDTAVMITSLAEFTYS